MDTETKIKLKPILLRSKLGQFVSEDEHAFARKCWRDWPKEYSALQTDEVNPEAAKQAPVTPPRDYINSNEGRSSRAARSARTPRPARTPRTPGSRGGRT